ncbi:MAG: autotransporter outer membrane beta-barrel domain-containing protein [Candidatus Kaistia colombiensis]|nr:MAG: autotransporter outer membrane beta-barrel domain-containing protein [Kaistia sp.]
MAIGLKNVTIAVLAGVMVAPGTALAASGSSGVWSSNGVAGAGGVDGNAEAAKGKKATTGSGGGGGGATDLTTGRGAAGGNFYSSTSTTSPASGTDGATDRSVVDEAISGTAGADGVNGTAATGGGGGGVGVVTTLDLTITATGAATGGAGGNGGASSGGGGGGVGVFASANVAIEAGGRVTGGAGGQLTGLGGSGGGAAALLVTGAGTVVNSGTLTGGAGGGNPSANLPNLKLSAAGGNGGEGVLLTNGGSIVNQAGGTITGGAGGRNGLNLANRGITASVGGAGIKGAGVTIVNAGTITGGMDGAIGGVPSDAAATTRANAIHFTGGVNSLEIHAGSTIVGNVIAASAADRLILGGTADASFDASSIGAAAQYRGFGIYEKTGASTWTLTGTTAATTPWTLREGALSIAADGSLGASGGALTFAGGMLQTTADIAMARAIVLQADGTIETAAGTRLDQAGIVSGAGSLIKTGAGTLGLSGTNTYAGETVIEAGVLGLTGSGSIEQSRRVVADGTFSIASTTDGASIRRLAGSGSVALGSKTLTLTAAADEFSGDIRGTGGLTLEAGRLVLSGTNDYSGDTTISGGTLEVGAANSLSAASSHIVASGGMLDLAGFNQTTGGLNNTGVVRLGDTANTTLTVAGNYVGTGGTLQISTVLGGDNSATDLLHVVGDTSGTTHVVVTNVGGAGAPTTGDGIRIVQVDGASAADAFVLNGPAIGGAHRYNLFQNDLTGTLDDGAWYLRADGLAPTLPTYESYPAVMLGLIALPTLQQRVGDRRPDKTGETANTALWTRIEGAHGRVKADDSTTGAGYDSDLYQLQVGLDGEVMETAAGTLVAGLTAQYSRASASVFSDLGNGSNTTEGYGIGASLTWYGQNGVYVDGQGQFAWFDTDLSADGVGKLADGNKGTGYALSIELGQELAVKDGWTVTPQAQLSYASADFDDFVDPFGAAVSLTKGESLKGRIGAALGRDTSWQDASGRAARTHVYGITSLTYELLDGATVAVSGVDLVAGPQKFGAEFGLGGTYNWGAEKYALHGEALASTSFDGSYGYKGTVGLTVGF